MPAREKPGGGEPLEPLHLLEDEPVLHHADDGLGLLSFARVVAGAAVGTTGPFTIGVFAGWGQGKTSVLRQARTLIDDDPAHAAVATVWFNAWRYEREEHPLVPLIGAVLREIEERRARLAGAGEKAKRWFGDLATALRAVPYGLALDVEAGVPFFGKARIKASGEKMISREEALLRGRRAKWEKGLYFEAFEKLEALAYPDAEAGAAGPGGRPKVVVFIDDLDRCQPDKAVRLLENLKLVLAQPGFVFVLAVARTAVDAFLAKRYEAFGVPRPRETGASYLDKIVQLPLGLPSHAGRFEGFIEHLLAKPALEHPSNADVRAALEPLREVLAAGAAYNPRSLVRLVNNLIVDQRIWVADRESDEEDARTALLGLCAVSRILRERLRDLYRSLVEDRELCGKLAAAEGPLEALALAERDEEGKPRGARETRRARVVAQLVEAELEGVLATGAGRAWLADHEEREAFDQFLVSRGEEDLEVEKIDPREIVENAIRSALGKKPGEPVGKAELERVRELDLSTQPQITDAALAPVAGLSGLEVLYLADTGIGDAGLEHLSGLSELTALYLDNTKVTDAGLEALLGLTGLETLSLDGTGISNAGLETLSKLTGLAHLSLFATEITDAGLETLSKLTGLAALHLSGTAITDAGLEPVSKLTGLTRLSLSGTEITDAGLESLSGLTGLTELRLSRTGITNAGLESLSGLTGLRVISLSYTKITNAGLNALAELTGLMELFLVGMKITDSGLNALSGLSRLEALYLSETKITDTGLEALSGLRGLKALFLSETKITDAGLEALSGLSGLQSLGVRGTGITDSGLEALAKLGSLRRVFVSRTGVTEEGRKQLAERRPEIRLRL